MGAEPLPSPESSRAAAAVAPPLPAGRADLLATVWTLAWPVIVTFSVESFVGLADMLMVGRLGASAVAGVGVGVQILSIVNAGMFAVGTGTLAIVARHVGAGERRAAEDVLFQSLVAAVAVTVVTVVPAVVFTPEIVRAFGVTPEVAATGTRFLRIVLFAIPAEAVVFVVALSLRGAGDMRTPLRVSVLVGAINIVAAWVLIFGRLGLPALGVAGAGCATVLAFTTGAVVSLALLVRRKLVLGLPRAPLRPRLEPIRRVLRIGYPAAVEHLLMQLGFLLYMVFAAHYGTSAVAAYVIGVRILALSFLPGFGFAAAAGTLVGQHLGAGQPREAERGGWASNGLAMALMSAAGVVLFLAARPVARLFVDDAAVVADAVPFIHVLAALQPLMAIDFTLGGALRGAGDTRFPLFAVVVGFYGCRLGFASVVTFGLGLGLLWLWLALVGDYCVRSMLKAHRFRSGRWKLIRV